MYKTCQCIQVVGHRFLRKDIILYSRRRFKSYPGSSFSFRRAGAFFRSCTLIPTNLRVNAFAWHFWISWTKSEQPGRALLMHKAIRRKNFDFKLALILPKGSTRLHHILRYERWVKISPQSWGLSQLHATTSASRRTGFSNSTDLTVQLHSEEFQPPPAPIQEQ